MEEWYERATTLGRQFDKYVKMPFIQQKSQSMKQLQSWVVMMNGQLDYTECQQQLLEERHSTEQDY